MPQRALAKIRLPSIVGEASSYRMPCHAAPEMRQPRTIADWPGPIRIPA